MIKTILVAASGGAGDQSVFETAFALAGPLAAHLDFYHLWVSPNESAALTPHVDFAQGRALSDALDQLQHEAEVRSASSARFFSEFCRANRIPIAEPGQATQGVTATFLEEKDDVMRRLILQARRHDLVVVGRPHVHGTRRTVAGHLLITSGRPVVIAPPIAKPAPFGVVMVGWKETAEAARALSAAVPILKNARRVVLASVEDGEPPLSPPSARELVRYLAWHDIRAEILPIAAHNRSIADLLHAASEGARADLLVIGAYGHSFVRELIFGGVTEALLVSAKLPILLTH